MVGMTSIHQPVRPFGRGTTLLRGLISHLLTGAKFRILALASTIACSAQRKETGTSNASPHILLHCSTVRLWQNALFRPGCITVLCHELLARVLGRFPHASLSCRQHEGTRIWCRQRRRLHRKNAYFPGNVVLDFISSNSRCKDASKVDMQMILQVHPQSLTVRP